MSILIKGMEMPKGIEPGLVIEFADGIDGKRYARLYHYRHGGLTEWLEAVPVPPHGRLIDADALRAKQQEDADLFQGSTDYGDKCRRDEAMNAVANIVNAPTIIPTEEGETCILM